MKDMQDLARQADSGNYNMPDDASGQEESPAVEKQEQSYLANIVAALTPDECQELDMLLKTRMQQDRMKGELSTEDVGEPAEVLEGGSPDASHMQELGR